MENETSHVEKLIKRACNRLNVNPHIENNKISREIKTYKSSRYKQYMKISIIRIIYEKKYSNLE